MLLFLSRSSCPTGGGVVATTPRRRPTHAACHRAAVVVAALRGKVVRPRRPYARGTRARRRTGGAGRGRSGAAAAATLCGRYAPGGQSLSFLACTTVQRGHAVVTLQPVVPPRAVRWRRTAFGAKSAERQGAGFSPPPPPWSAYRPVGSSAAVLPPPLGFDRIQKYVVAQMGQRPAGRRNPALPRTRRGRGPNEETPRRHRGKETTLGPGGRRGGGGDSTGTAQGGGGQRVRAVGVTGEGTSSSRPVATAMPERWQREVGWPFAAGGSAPRNGFGPERRSPPLCWGGHPRRGRRHHPSPCTPTPGSAGESAVRYWKRFLL